MNLPNFLIIGAAKAGTTSLYSYLNQHPEIYFSPFKEPRFFALEGLEVNYQGPSQVINEKAINTLDEYTKLFEEVKEEKAIGEASTLYLYSDRASERIKQYIPQVKLIAVLRNPIDRAYSSYSHLVRDGYETLSFAEALAAEAERIDRNWPPLWHYQARGFYYQQLAKYYALFPAEQIKVYLYDDFTNNPLGVAADIFDFLGVDTNFMPNTSQKMNVSGAPKNKALHKIITQDNPLKSIVKQFFPQDLRKTLYKKIKSSNLGKSAKMPIEVRTQLINLYRDDVSKLEKLIDRDLSDWLKSPATKQLVTSK